MNQTMTISQMCAAFSVAPRTLRFYESKELLAPIRQGQKRLFTRRDRARLKLIQQGKRFGFSLEEIRQLLDLYSKDDNQEAQLREGNRIGLLHLDLMIAQRESLDTAIAELREVIDRNESRLRELTPMVQAAE